MAAGQTWQPYYTDLSDDRFVRFGAHCAVCGAHYSTAPVPLVAIIPADREPDPPTARAIEAQKGEIFEALDAAFRSITILCYRCGNPACPDCWDVDKQMCGACVAERGLIRSPHRGGPVEGPLAEGFLQRDEPGRYSEVSRPAWLKELLRIQADPGGMAATGITAPPRSSAPDEGAPSARPIPPDSGEYPRAPTLPHAQATFDPPPTSKMSSQTNPPVLVPAVPSGPLGRVESEATASMVACPRCGTANYDFVTQCSGCGLQLIQICPNCEKLNPGHVQRCQFCKASMARPRGWSGVFRTIVPLEPDEARRRMLGHGTAPPVVSSGPQVRRPVPWEESRARVAPTPPPAPPVEEARAVSPDPALWPMSAPAYVPAAQVAQHPYEVNSLTEFAPRSALSKRPSATRQVMTALAILVERVVSLVVLLGLFIAVGLIAAAEASPQANHTLTMLLHFDIHQHVYYLLQQLHVQP